MRKYGKYTKLLLKSDSPGMLLYLIKVHNTIESSADTHNGIHGYVYGDDPILF